MKKKAMYFKTLEGQKVLCKLCPHYCIIENNKIGKCKVRQNEDGVLFTINYGSVSSIAIDPIEKKPLYHYYPGSQVLSIATYGCNFSCDFCQNHRISQNIVESKYLSPENLVELVINDSENLGIAFTYNEPVIWYEYIYDTAKLLKEKKSNKKVILVTNGFVNEKPFLKLKPYIDALNIDLKSSKDDFYKDVCGGLLEPVKNIISLSYDIHLEITTLMVSNEVTCNDIKELSKYIRTINKNIPYHISRYFPNYKYNDKFTGLGDLLEANKIAGKELEYVYLGNVAGIDSNTYCPKCNILLIERNGYEVRNLNKSSICNSCGYELNIKI